MQSSNESNLYEYNVLINELVKFNLNESTTLTPRHKALRSLNLHQLCVSRITRVIDSIFHCLSSNSYFSAGNDPQYTYINI